MTPWKRNVAAVWLSQFFSMMGFSFAMPFAPYYLQDLGIRDPAALKLWVAMFGAATPLALAVFSPVWGTLADRYGRRPMLIRANLAGAVVLTLMGVVATPVQLIALRLLQGVFTGTMTAAQTMVSVHAPAHRSGFALGTLTAAVFSGTMVGSLVGGAVSEWLGYRMSFVGGGMLLLTAAVLVVFGTREVFTQEDLSVEGKPLFRLQPPQFGAALPVLAMIMAVSFVRLFDQAFLPLLVQEIHGSLRGVALWAGALSASGGVAGLLAGVTLGRLGDRMEPCRVIRIAAVAAAALMIPQGLAHSFGVLFPARFGAVFAAGGLEPVFHLWLTRITPENRRGFVFGWAGTARSLGWVAAPLASGLVATGFGVRSIYVVQGALYLLLIPLTAAVLRRAAKGGRPDPVVNGLKPEL